MSKEWKPSDMKRRILSILSILAFLVCCMASRSCANTTTPPSGGPKDTIPPVLLKINPENNTTNFPIYGQKIELLYNEYTVVKDNQGIIVSPPQKHRLKTKIKGKNIIVSLPDSLKEDHTYTIDFGTALADNNEGNPAPRFVYAFSTGEVIDSMYFTGTIIDCQSLAPVKGVTVAAFSDLSDSACFNTIPDAAVKTDDWGFFTIRNIKPVQYRVYAYSDLDGDYKYDPDNDNIAFLDSVFTPTKVVRDSIKELYGTFLMKDTLKCKSRESMMKLSMFKELQSVQYLQNKGRKTRNSGFLKFSASDVKINELEFVGIPAESVILQYNQSRDSIDFWINVNYRLDDSLMIRLNYMKTDSTGTLSPFTENLSLAVMEEKTTSLASYGNIGNLPTPTGPKKEKEKDTVFKATVVVANETVEDDGLYIESELPIIKILQDSIILTETNPKGQSVSKAFTMTQDKKNIRRYIFKPVDPLIKGYAYDMHFGQGAFTNLDKLPNQEADASFQIPQSEELCTLSLKMKNASTNYLVDLVGEKDDRAQRSYQVDSDRTVEIKYLNAGTYRIRITRDSNRNGYADTGNLLEKRQPEEVRFYEMSAGSNLLEIPASAEIEQDIDLKKVFE